MPATCGQPSLPTAGFSVFAFAPRVIGGTDRNFGSVFLGDPIGTQLVLMQNDNYVLPMYVGSASLDTGTDSRCRPATSNATT